MTEAPASLYLHEVVDIVGRGAAPYMAHVVGFDSAAVADRSLRLVGTWEVVGTTGRWPQVVNLWEIVGGWDGWRRLCDCTNVSKAANAELATWWDEAYRHRTGGFDRVLAAAPGCPTLDQLLAGGVRGSLFVHELTRVAQGAGDEYLTAVVDEWAPVIEQYGHRLVHASSVQWRDDEVCTVWSTDLDGHIALQQAPEPAGWAKRRRALTTRWHEELMTPGAGTPLARG
ncbi:MAG: hypothetical protein ACRD0G_07995 [Acidimicrobiales bacterium]